MNRHPFAWGSAVFGILFAAATAIWTVRELELLDAGAVGVLVAGTLVALGLLGVVATVAISRRPRTPDSLDMTDDQSDERVEADDPETAEEAGDGTSTAPQRH